jgi:hypothetical protein
MSWGDPSGLWSEGQAFLATYQSDETLTLEKLPWVKLGDLKIHYLILK